MSPDNKIEFDKSFFKNIKIEKDVWIFLYNAEYSEDNKNKLRKALINKNYSLSNIEYLELKFLQHNMKNITVELYQSSIKKHKEFWKKGVNEFLTHDKKLVSSFLNKDSQALKNYLHKNNFDLQLCNHIITDWNVHHKDLQIQKMEFKNLNDSSNTIKLSDVLELTTSTKNKLANLNENQILYYEKVIQEFARGYKKSKLQKSNNQNLVEKKSQEEKTKLQNENEELKKLMEQVAEVTNNFKQNKKM